MTVSANRPCRAEILFLKQLPPTFCVQATAPFFPHGSLLLSCFLTAILSPGNHHDLLTELSQGSSSLSSTGKYFPFATLMR